MFPKICCRSGHSQRLLATLGSVGTLPSNSHCNTLEMWVRRCSHAVPCRAQHKSKTTHKCAANRSIG